MNHISSERLIEDQGAVSHTPIIAHRMLILIAWVATLLLSKLPLVIARDLLGTDIPWITPAWIGFAALLFATTYFWSAIRPLRGYFMIMEVILLIGFWFDPFIHQTAAWQNLFSGRSQMVSLFGERVLLALESLVVISALFLIGIKPRDAFLMIGNLKAPVGGKNMSTRRQILSWSVFGPVMAVLLGGLFFAFLASQTSGGMSNITAIFPWPPLILLSAMLNAFSEEVTYRAAPLATFLPAIGPKHAIWLTSLWFGLGHYYGGIPSGLIGLVQTGLLALLLGRAMLDTRGLGWSWIIHMTLDTVIYFFIAMTMG